MTPSRPGLKTVSVSAMHPLRSPLVLNVVRCGTTRREFLREPFLSRPRDRAADGQHGRMADTGWLRREYESNPFLEPDLAPTWWEQFDRWFAEARPLTEPNAMVVATV